MSDQYLEHVTSQSATVMIFGKLTRKSNLQFKIMFLFCSMCVIMLATCSSKFSTVESESVNNPRKWKCNNPNQSYDIKSAVTIYHLFILVILPLLKLIPLGPFIFSGTIKFDIIQNLCAFPFTVFNIEFETTHEHPINKIENII